MDIYLKSRRSQALPQPPVGLCLLYTSDAADDLIGVDLGGRRIIKNKIEQNTLLSRFQDTTIAVNSSCSLYEPAMV